MCFFSFLLLKIIGFLLRNVCTTFGIVSQRFILHTTLDWMPLSARVIMVRANFDSDLGSRNGKKREREKDRKKARSCCNNHLIAHQRGKKHEIKIIQKRSYENVSSDLFFFFYFLKRSKREKEGMKRRRRKKNVQTLWLVCSRCKGIW